MSLNKLPILRVKIADTFETQTKGLMFVKEMPIDAGMLFVFSSSKKLSFWGENTFIPLDIAFVDENNKIINIEKIYPLSKKSVYSQSPCKYAVEANLGFFEDNGIRAGDVMIYNKKTSSVLFAKRNSKEYVFSKKIAQQISDDFDFNKYPTLSDYFNHLDSQNSQTIEETNLPVLSQEEIGQYIEDSIQDQQNQQQEDGLSIDQKDKLEDIKPENVEELQERIPRFNNISEAFNWAQENKEVMKISYQTKTKKKGLRFFGNNLIIRYIEPHGRFTSHPENEPSHEILVTFDETVGGIRAFRMQNVKEFSIVGKKFNPKFIVR